MSKNIHPTAVIHPEAQIGENTIIGPGVIIGEDVHIGPDCNIKAHAVIFKHARIGQGNTIGFGAVIAEDPQDVTYQGDISYVHIGDHNTIREYVTIHRGTKKDSVTSVGSHNFFMAGSHVGHNCQVGNHVILVNNVLLGGYVQVQDRAFMGGASVVHQYTRIGELAMVRGQTRLGMDLPPFFMAVATNTVCGLNRVGLRRNNYAPAQRKPILNAYNLFYYSGLNRQQAMQRMLEDPEFQTPEVKRIHDFLGQTTRGICRAVKAKHVSADPNDSPD